MISSWFLKLLGVHSCIIIECVEFGHVILLYMNQLIIDTYYISSSKCPWVLMAQKRIAPTDITCVTSKIHDPIVIAK